MKNNELKYAKRLALGVLTVVVLGVGALTAKVQAQTAGSFEIQVPFEFVVMGKTYPAAKYRVARLSEANPNTLVLNTITGKTLLIVHTQRSNAGVPAEFSMLSFSQSGQTHFLEGIRASGSSYESRLPSTKSDRRRSIVLAQTAQIVSISNKR